MTSTSSTASDEPSAVLGGPELPQVRLLRTAIPGPRSAGFLARKAAAVPPGVAHTVPIQVVAAGGGVVVDADGNSLIDLAAGIAVTTLGNAHPAVVAAVRDQVERYTHTCFMVAPYEPYVAVAEELNRLTPGDFEKRTILLNSGAEAVENAVKIARKFTGRNGVVVFDHGYHGRTNLTMAMTAKAMPYKAGFGPFAPDVHRVAGSYPFRDGLDGPAAAARAIARIRTQVGDDLAAIVIEPIQGWLRGAGRRLPARPGGVLPRGGRGLRRRRDPDRFRPHRERSCDERNREAPSTAQSGRARPLHRRGVARGVRWGDLRCRGSGDR